MPSESDRDEDGQRGGGVLRGRRGRDFRCCGRVLGAKNLIINVPALGRSVNFPFFARWSTSV